MKWLEQNLEDLQSEDGNFECPKCHEKFARGQALGGHMSRVHPGGSDTYNKKLKRREERTQERKILKLAKEKFFKLYGKNKELDRVKIRRYKKEIKKKLGLNDSE
mmetsp:Transcript_25880/g.25150  ORF Transcript_25880/g.25150 Transcript_25880/m.25150 type:complete len:105 (+) Transcript_25880:206-520(+)